MSIIIGLADELDNAATVLEGQYSWTPDTYAQSFPRAVNLLRAKAKQLRQPEGKRGKAKTVKAWVGKRRSKASEIRIKADRIQ